MQSHARSGFDIAHSRRNTPVRAPLKTFKKHEQQELASGLLFNKDLTATNDPAFKRSRTIFCSLAPHEMSDRVPRAVVAYKQTNQIFVQKEKNYIQQYSHVYLKRLLALRPVLQRYFRDVAKCPLAEKVIGLTSGERVAVIGTLYKDQKLKPNILDEFTTEVLESPIASRENYASEDDALLIEDESGRCTLQGGESWAQFVATAVSGVVVGCVGKLAENGSLEVEEVVFPGDTITRDVGAFALEDEHPATQSPRYLLLTSGIYAGSTADDNSLLLQMLVDYVGGFLGDPAKAASIVRVVVAGGAISPPRADDVFKNTTLDAKLQVDSQEVLVESLRVADNWFAELASTCPVDIMPGESDPCNISLPQQPLHPCLFPTAFRYSGSSFRSTTNPHSFLLGKNLQVLGHSGQPSRDALRSMISTASPLAFLETSLLRYMHIAPTAPDTLACYPFFDRDPFVVEKPNVRLFFAGCCSAFETSHKQGVRFVCVPDFKHTKQVVLVNLDTPDLDAQVVTFDIQMAA
jgi:DNA polymerase delta subunit 2